MGRVLARRRVTRIRAGGPIARPDQLAVEEPLEVRVDGQALAVTMRTPGDDFELVQGFLVTEGVTVAGGDGPGTVETLRYCAGATDEGLNTYNVIDVARRPGGPALDAARRNFLTSSSCGVCGKSSLDSVRTTLPWDIGADPVTVTTQVLAGLPDTLRQAQKVFERTGGLHAAGLFAPDGTLLCLREDVGRHNAVDKVVGWASMHGLVPLRGHVLLVSGRASFEVTQKALMAGVPVLAAVSAPSSLAADLAAETGMTLVGFLRGPDMNVYAGDHRVVVA